MAKPQKDLPKVNYWQQNDGEIDIAAFLVLRRNLDKFLFPPKLDKEKRSQILSLLSQKLLQSSPGDRLFKGEDCSPIDKEWFQEHFFVQNSLQEIHKGEGFLINNRGNIAAFFNIGDHLSLRFLGAKAELEEGWKELSKKDDFLQEGSPFAFSPYFGFLTTLPREAGTGLEVQILLQTPALSLFREEEHLLFKDEDRIDPLPLFSENAGVDRGLLLIRNHSSIGMSEDQILSLVKGFAEKVIAKEQFLRKKLIETQTSQIKDRVSRAFGLLLHSYQIETLETLEAFGWIKFGLEQKFISGVDRKKLNRLLIDVRRGHLSDKTEGEGSREELLHRRSELLHEELKGMQLCI